MRENIGAAVTPSRLASSPRTLLSISLSLALNSSGCKLPPTKARSKILSCGARPGYFKLLKVQAMILRFSMAGTTKPKLFGAWGKSSRR